MKHTIYKLLEKMNLRVTKVFPRPFERFGIKGNNLIGAEIGVRHGYHAESMLKHLDIKTIFLIDPYLDYEECLDFEYLGDDPNRAQIVTNTKDNAFFYLSKFGAKCQWVYKMSDDALKKVPNNLDFVYIDGNHSYKYVKKDLENYYYKLKKGGVIGGHDIWNVSGCPQDFNGVVEAVTEFAVENNLKLFIQHPDWWFVRGLHKK